MISLDILKYGKRHAVTFSYDDGSIKDRQLVELFNKYGLKGTFHLNSGKILARSGHHVTPEEIPTLYAGHEVACHGVTHTSPTSLERAALIGEMFEDRKNLEAMTGYPVCGLSYANGLYNDLTVETVRSCGIVYSRTTVSTNKFDLPRENFLTWHPTCHQRDGVAMAEKFMTAIGGYYSGPKLLYIWGHSHEFEGKVTWETAETFCRIVSGCDQLWYAANMEIYSYVQAMNRLVVSADQNMVWNPSAEEVWFSCDGKICSVKPGGLWKKAD